VSAANPAQDRAEALEARLSPAVAAAVAELAALNREARSARIGEWMVHYQRTIIEYGDLGFYARWPVECPEPVFIALARGVALRSRNPYGTKVFGLIFCALHYPDGIRAGGRFYNCPACTAIFASHNPETATARPAVTVDLPEGDQA
jgi:hypothetical protein